MNTSRWAVAAMAFVLGGSVFLFAEEPKADSADGAKPAASPAAAGEPAAGAESTGEPATADAGAKKGMRKGRLTKPWKDLSSLTDDQKAQIIAIHRKAVQEIKQIEQREREEIMALLDDAQKTELQALTDKAAANRKARKPAAKKPAGDAAATSDGDERAG